MHKIYLGCKNPKLEMEPLLNREESGVRGKKNLQFGAALRDYRSIEFYHCQALSDRLSNPLFYRSVKMWPRDLGFTFIAESGVLEFQVSSVTMRETRVVHP